MPPNLPTVATTTISPHISHSPPADTRPICVRIPVNAKNAGRSRTVTTSVSFRPMSRASRLSCGITAPSRNAPKTAWMPIASVASAASSTPTMTTAIVPRAGGSSPMPADARGHQRPDDERTSRRRTRPPRRSPERRRHLRLGPRRRRTPAGTRRSRRRRPRPPRAVTPSGVRSSPRSVRMRASTGNAVIDIATPMNRAKLVNGTALVGDGRVQPQGQGRPERRTGRRCWRARWRRPTVRDRRSWPAFSSSPTRNMYRMTPSWAIDPEVRGRVRRQAGSAIASGDSRPSSDGPSRMPATTSPITGGWPM